MIKLIIFDAEHVLYNAEDQIRYFNSKLAEFIKINSSISLEETGAIWKDLGKAVVVGKMSVLQAHKEFISRMGIRPELIDEYEKFDRESFNYAKPMENGEERYLKDLKKKNYKLAVLSDGVNTADTKALILKIIGLDGIFDRVFVSSDIGHKKPDRETYETVMDAFKVKPSETVFVGHDLDELEGAMALGIHVISYKGDKLGHEASDFHRMNEIIYSLDR